MKIEKFSEAIDDCCKVLEMEPKNLKGTLSLVLALNDTKVIFDFPCFSNAAFVRRGIAYKALKQYELAAKDFNSILSIDPKNKRAKVL